MSDDGGQAFPSKSELRDGTKPGMTLRDYFAAKQLEAYKAHPANEGIDGLSHVAKYCYAMADAMLTERAK